MNAGDETDEAIIKSLRRSKVRIIVLLFIAQSYYGQANLKDLHNSLNLCQTNILGALVGSDGRYKCEDSLVCMGLLERVETSIDDFKMIHYKITEKGTRVARIFEKETMSTIILDKLKVY